MFNLTLAALLTRHNSELLLLFSWRITFLAYQKYTNHCSNQGSEHFWSDQVFLVVTPTYDFAVHNHSPCALIVLHLLAHPSGQTKVYQFRLTASARVLILLVLLSINQNVMVNPLLFRWASTCGLSTKCGFIFRTEVWKSDSLDSVCSSSTSLFHAFSQISWDLDLSSALRVQIAFPPFGACLISK